jgi:adenosine/AMP kinase
MRLLTVRVEKPEAVHVLVGQAHAASTVEDLHAALAGAVPGLRFGLGLCEANGPCLVRLSGTDDALIATARANAAALGAGGGFVVFLDAGGPPLNVLDALKLVPGVCRIFGATAGPAEVVLAETDRGRGILGVVDGGPARGVEDPEETARRAAHLHRIGYKF